MRRREFVKYTILATNTLILTACGKSSNSTPIQQNSTINQETLNNHSNNPSNIQQNRRKLPIPPLVNPRIIDGVKHFNLQLHHSQKEFFEGVASPTYAINGLDYLGPTIKVKNNDVISINYTNNLDFTTTMHGHGMHVPASMDGGPHQLIQPNQTWSAKYQVKQKASTNWYHPHKMGETAQHVYYGLAGLIIIEDEESQNLPLPQEYGIDDIPLVIQDRRFKNQKLDYTPTRMDIMRGYRGDIFLVNGAIEPFFEAKSSWIRFRILNGSNAGVYAIGFEDNRIFYQIAGDNSFLEKPTALQKLWLSPGERAEIMIDLTNELNKRLILKELNQNRTILTIEVTQKGVSNTSLPQKLTTLEKFTINDIQFQRDFTLDMLMGSFTINGVSMDMDIINEYIPLNQIELWNITNNSPMQHNFHTHATHFMIISRDGSEQNVPNNERCYKDTLYMPPNSTAQVIIKMKDYKDEQNPYMYHCHFLEHEDNGMMGQFVVI